MGLLWIRIQKVGLMKGGTSIEGTSQRVSGPHQTCSYQGPSLAIVQLPGGFSLAKQNSVLINKGKFT